MPPPPLLRPVLKREAEVSRGTLQSCPPALPPIATAEVHENGLHKDGVRGVAADLTLRAPGPSSGPDLGPDLGPDYGLGHSPQNCHPVCDASVPNHQLRDPRIKRLPPYIRRRFGGFPRRGRNIGHTTSIRDQMRRRRQRRILPSPTMAHRMTQNVGRGQLSHQTDNGPQILETGAIDVDGDEGQSADGEGDADEEAGTGAVAVRSTG